MEALQVMRDDGQYAGDFRSYYTQRLAQRGLGYEQYAPAFR
jgi:hypothetical protein